MASLHALVPALAQSAFMNVSIQQQHRLDRLKQINHHRWTYLLADNLRFSDKHQSAIRMAKPPKALLVKYLEQIISAGQCCTIFVEQMKLDEMNTQRIKQLCIQYNVTLVNLQLNNQQHGTLVKGPW